MNDSSYVKSLDPKNLTEKSSHRIKKRQVGYLSGAPRVSTRIEAEAGGARAHVLGVIKAFAALDWEVKSLIVGNRVPLQWVRQGSEHSVSNGFLRTLATDFVRLFMAYRNERRAWQELGKQVDWVYERFGIFQALGKQFQRQGIPWILETNAVLSEEAKSERKSIILVSLARYLEVQAYQTCDVLICVSNALKQRIVQEIGIPEEKVLVVHNGVDTEFFDPDKYTAKRMFDGFTVGFVGGLFAWQGLSLLLQALSELHQEAGIKINLLILGDGALRQEWEALAQELGLATQVQFLGWLPPAELPPLIAGFDVGYSGHVDLQGGKVYRSPLKLYEYMAMAKPVITSSVEDVEALVQHGSTGFLFSPGDLAGIKLALLEAYNLREQLNEMGRRAREEVVANHSWIARVETMIAGVERILGKRSKPLCI